MSNKKYWIATISKDHVLKGQEWEIMQVCHGKKAPLQRINQGDLILFYSPKQKRDDKTPLQLFTAIAVATDDDVYQVKQFENFEPFRRKVEFLNCEETAIRPLINELDFIKDKQRWGFPFRYGLLEISEKDFRFISARMKLRYEQRESV